MCPAGHPSRATDFCDECGLPIPAGAAAARPPAVVPAAPRGQKCPNCGTFSPQDALFCEACGYDFITGTMPRGTASELLGLAQADATPPNAMPATPPTPEVPSQAARVVGPAATPAPPRDVPPATIAHGTSDLPLPDLPSAPSIAIPPTTSPDEDAGGPARGVQASLPWVAEVWIDPDWYRLQDSPDPLPSPGLPEIFPLPADGALIGRASRSQHLTPDIDCGTDSGCSRRQAQLTADGRRWWVEDLGSANGTFVGLTGEPLPATPITTGRTELTSDSRIYVGAWTRIVIRLATEEELGQFA